MRISSALFAGALLSTIVALVGCDNSTPKTTAEIKALYAEQFAQGAHMGMTYIEADRVDPKTHDLINVRIESLHSLYAADRGVIIVNPIDKTIHIRLLGVVGAGDDGMLVDLGDISTPPTKLRHKISDAPSPPVVENR